MIVVVVMVAVDRPSLRRYGAHLGTNSVGPGSQSTCTNKVCRIGRGAQLGAIGPIGLRPAPVVDLILVAAAVAVVF